MAADEMGEQQSTDEPWWKRELRKRRGKIKRQRGIIEHMTAALLKHNVPEHDWRFDESSDEEFDKGFFVSKVYELSKQNIESSSPRTEIIGKLDAGDAIRRENIRQVLQVLKDLDKENCS